MACRSRVRPPWPSVRDQLALQDLDHLGVGDAVGLDPERVELVGLDNPVDQVGGVALDDAHECRSQGLSPVGEEIVDGGLHIDRAEEPVGQPGRQGRRDSLVLHQRATVST